MKFDKKPYATIGSVRRHEQNENGAKRSLSLLEKDESKVPESLKID